MTALSDYDVSERAASAKSILNDAVVDEAFTSMHATYLNELMRAEVGSSKAATAHAKLMVLADFRTSLQSMVTEKMMRDRRRGVTRG